jgi:hypothetical protein
VEAAAQGGGSGAAPQVVRFEVKRAVRRSCLAAAAAALLWALAAHHWAARAKHAREAAHDRRACAACGAFSKW